MNIWGSTRPSLPIVTLDLNVNVVTRLNNLQTWATAWQEEERRLRQQLASLNPNKRVDVLRGSQIGSLRRAKRLTQQPIYLDPNHVRKVGFTRLRQHLARQYAVLSASERRLWLTNRIIAHSDLTGPSRNFRGFAITVVWGSNVAFCSVVYQVLGRVVY